MIETLPPGWLNETEAGILADLARDRFVVEVGAWLGRSTTAMARTAKAVISIDHHHGTPGETPVDDPMLPTIRHYLKNLEDFGVSERVVPVVAGFERIASFLKPNHFEMAFIDGAHDTLSVLRDGRMCALLLRLGSPIVFHDYAEWIGVRSAVDELAQRWEQKPELPAGTTMAILHKR